MINSVYGKTMEILRKGISVKIVTNEKDYSKHVSKPTFIIQKIFDEYFVAIHEIKPVNKTVYVRFTVLELSKWLMYDFHYNFIKKYFHAELLFTDTDSLTYEIKSEDVYEEFFKHKNLFVFSNFSKESKFYDNQNEMVVGKMKDEYKGIPITKFVGLKWKMHGMLSDDGKESNTAKGVNTRMELKEYEGTLLNKKVIWHKMKRMQSKKHKIGTYEINKISFSCFDDKRFVLEGGIHTFAYFHKDLNK